MANTPQSAKRARQAERRRLRGQSLRSQIRTAVKKTRAAAGDGQTELAQKNFRAFQTIADRLAHRGVVHPNTIGRLKSRLNAELKKAQERAQDAKLRAAEAEKIAEEQAADEALRADAPQAQTQTLAAAVAQNIRREDETQPDAKTKTKTETKAEAEAETADQAASAKTETKAETKAEAQAETETKAEAATETEKPKAEAQAQPAKTEQPDSGPDASDSAPKTDAADSTDSADSGVGKKAD